MPRKKPTSKAQQADRQPPDHPGLEALALCASQMRVEERWGVFHGLGFEWWNDAFRQRLWTTDPWIDQDVGLPTCLVCAETDIAVGEIPDALSTAFGMNMALSSMSGLVRNEETGVLALQCATRVCQGDMVSSAWFATAASIQQWTAARLAAQLQAKFGLSPSTSAHPVEGPRPEPGLSLAKFVGEVTWMASGPLSQWDSPEDFEEALGALRRAEVEAAEADDDVRGRLFANLPFGSSQGVGDDSKAVSTLLRVFVNQPHPDLGEGLTCLLFLPPHALALRPDLTPVRLNTLEARLLDGPRRMGSWCLFPGGPGGEEVTPAYVAFAPSVLYGPGALREVCFGMVLRAMWANQVFHTPPPGG